MVLTVDLWTLLLEHLSTAIGYATTLFFFTLDTDSLT